MWIKQDRERNRVGVKMEFLVLWEWEVMATLTMI